MVGGGLLSQSLIAPLIPPYTYSITVIVHSFDFTLQALSGLIGRENRALRERGKMPLPHIA